jgi:prolyl oligopeptidase
MKRSVFTGVISLCLLAGCTPPTSTQQEEQKSMTSTTVTAPLWLEDVEGQQALDKVSGWNKSTLDKLTADPRYEGYRQAALTIVNASDKIPYGSYRGDKVYNFWQDENHVRGVLRRTSLGQYAEQQPQWETLLDIDELSSREEKNWVYKGSSCLESNIERCMVSLSNGGKDAAEVREWDHGTKSFIKDGFFVPEAKSSISWADADTLHVATNWGENSLTDSGYPYIVKAYKRGQSLTDASLLFSGEKTDVGVFPFSLTFGARQLNFVVRAVTFFEAENFWLSDSGEVVPLGLPNTANITGIFKGQLLVSLKDDWTPADSNTTFKSGALVAFDMQHWMDTKTIGAVSLVYQPTERATLDSVSITANKLVLNRLENVANNIYVYDFDGTWQNTKLALPENGSMSVSSANNDSDIIFVSQESFVSPDTLFQVDVKSAKISILKSIPPRFDAKDLVVEQRFANSTDGVQIPYFVIHKQGMQYDGSNPTLQYAYGGFEVSMKPSYSGILGKNWLEQGGVYVLANIRGGGEFGPAWHQAGLKTKRQIIYDDMIAVAEDIIAKKITSPKHLGIMGGSNGGLLMGVMYTQRPDLWNAVVCQVPLLDMLRFHTLLAGASWVGEYGSPDVPEERAFLEKISPLHNIDPTGQYPSILFVTSTKDDRVHPGHARKMAYMLEQYGHDFEYYENIDGGHSASANLQETAKRTALEYTFLSQKLMN